MQIPLAGKRDLIFLTVLTLFSLGMRLYLLTFYPTPVFDEISYVPHGNEMISTNVITPTHPPLGLFLISLGGRLWGSNSWGFRLLPALFGTFCIPLVYLLALKLWNKREIALLASIFLTFDPMHFVMSRLALLDIFSCFFILITAYLYSCRKWTLCGVFLGFALCVKWSALVIIPALSILMLSDIRGKKMSHREIFRSLFSIFILPILVYLLLFSALSGRFNPEIILEAHKYIFFKLYLIPKSAYLCSPWWSWLLIPQFIPLGEKTLTVSGTNITLVMKLIESPALLWAGALAILISLKDLILDARRNKPEAPYLPLIFFIFLYVPWMLSVRGTYFFYLLPAIPYLCIILASTLDRYMSKGKLRLVRIIFVIDLVFSFFMLYPHLVGWLE